VSKSIQTSDEGSNCITFDARLKDARLANSLFLPSYKGYLGFLPHTLFLSE